MRRFIGSKKFYKMVLAIAIPIVIQNGITNFVGLLDNIMVGRVGTDQMSGVSIVNQLIFVFNLCIFGAISGVGIFSAQYHGQKNHEGVRNSFRFKLVVCFLLTLIGVGVFLFWGDALIHLYLHEGSNTGNIAETLKFAKKYLWIMLFGLLPFAIEQSYSGTLRETGETVVPMKAGIIAVFVNLIFNYLLIYGKFGIPVMGVQGAAIATVISRFVECTIIVLWTHKNFKRNLFIQGVYHHFNIPIDLCKKIIIKGMPLLINEFLWSSGMAIMTQCYSVKGLAVIAGLNISTTITNLFSIFTFAMGSTVAIIVGQKLGAGHFEDAKDTAGKIIFMSVSASAVVGFIMILLSPLFPAIYNTSDEVKTLAKSFIQIFGLSMPIQAYTNAAYFTLRSGGKTFITFLFDSVYVWSIAIPTAFMLTRYTTLSILAIYFICQFIDIIKCAVGFFMLKKGIWLQNIVN